MRRVAFVTAVLLGLVGCGGDETTGPSEAKTSTSGEVQPGTGLRNPLMQGPAFAVSSSTNPGTSILTDKEDYVPHEPVGMIGAGWQPGETVTLTLVEDPQIHAARTYTVIADTLGNFVYEDFAPEDHHAGVAFLLTAVGQSSGWQAQTTFTDGIASGGSFASFNGTTTSGSSMLMLSAPAVNPGDLLIAQVTVGKDLNPGDVICYPVGWDTLPRTKYDTKLMQQVFYKVAQVGSAGVTVTWHFKSNRASCGTSSSTLSGKGAAGGIIRYTGVDPTSPIDVHKDSVRTNSNTTITAPSVTTTAAGARVLRFYSAFKAAGSSTGITITPISSRIYIAGSTNNSTERTAAAFDSAQVAAGPTGAFSRTLGSSAEWISQTVALRMAAEPTTTTLTATPASEQTSGQSVTFTATVKKTADNSAVNAGTVKFYDGGTSCTDLSGATQIGSDMTVNASGQAAVSTSGLSVGAHTILACYGGTAAFQASGTSSQYTITALQPTKLVFTTDPRTGTVGTCLAVITVQTQNASDAATNVTVNTTVNLTTDAANASGAGTFHSDDTCTSPNAITSVVIAVGANSANFYYKGTAIGDGSHLVTAAATGLTSATQTETITAAPNSAPTVSAGTSYGATEGTSITMTPAANDPDGDELTYAWTYVEVSGVDAGTTCSFSATNIEDPTFTCDDNGTFEVKLEVDDGNGHTESATAAVIFSNGNPAATFTPPGATNEGSSFSLALTGATDPGAHDVLTYAFDCGDGAGYGAASGTANRTCPTSDGGTRAVKAKVLDDNGGAAEYTGSVTVNNANPTATFSATPTTVSEGGSYSLALASPSDPSSADVAAGFRYAFDCGDGAGYGTATSYATANATASRSCTAADNTGSPRTVKGKVFDKDDGATEYTGSVAVNNTPPVLSAITAPVTPVLVNSSINASATFTDAGQDDDPWNYSINWGDATANTTGSVNTWAATMSISGSHTYTAPGVYTITMTVADKDGASDTEEFQYVVVYDPSAGFITGGGWINSPVGACRFALCTEETTGKANFGFVSKYLKGAAVPTGNTQFQFHAGNLDFKSTSYQWLVVQGKDRASFKGYGTIDGAGNYGFLLSAVDAATGDRFRIKIWDATTGTIVYDNQMGSPDDAVASMVIANGSIVIHAGK